MKKIKFDKIVSLVVDEMNWDTVVAINWLQLIHENDVLKEKDSTITPDKAKEITDKYEKQADWQLSKEDFEKVQEEIETYNINKEIVIYIGEVNAIQEVKKVLALTN